MDFELLVKEKHDELINILQELIDTINEMRLVVTDYLLYQNEREAKEWLDFLIAHSNKEELKTLEIEISNRFFTTYDVQICCDELDNKRVGLMKKYILKSNDYLR
jgi:hypothetical protein